MPTLTPPPEQTIVSLSESYRQGSTTPSAVIQNALSIIDQYEPQLHAWVSLFREEALHQAEQQTQAFAQGDDPGPLAGIPIGVKDIIDQAPFPTGCGFIPLADHPAQSTAPLLEKLISAGAIVLGKTVTTQFACFDPAETRNPWNLEHTPGGSSSGSASAVSQGMCVAALGTQTGGSVTRPAAFCGIVGFKPGFNTLNSKGIFPVSQHLDQPGLFTSCVADAQIMWDLFSPSSSENNTDIRFGRIHRYFDEHSEPEMKLMMDELCVLLKKHHHPTDEVASEFDFEAILPHHWNIMVYDAAQVHRDLFDQHREHYLPGMTSLIEAGRELSENEYQDSLQVQQKLQHEVVGSFSDSNVWLTPATLGEAPDLSTTGNPQFNSPWSFLGLPTMTLPVKRSNNGLPLGVQLIAKPDHENQLLNAAQLLEKLIQDH